MSEPENFEDDLFEDLYVANASSVKYAQAKLTVSSYDDTDAPKSAPPPAPVAPSSAPVEQSKQPENNGHSGQATNQYDPGAADNMNQDQGADDSDDDVDFNLGGGGTTSANNGNNHNNAAVSEYRDHAPTPPSYGAVHKASAKEDG